MLKLTINKDNDQLSSKIMTNIWCTCKGNVNIEKKHGSSALQDIKKHLICLRINFDAYINSLLNISLSTTVWQLSIYFNACVTTCISGTYSIWVLYNSVYCLGHSPIQTMSNLNVLKHQKKNDWTRWLVYL